MAGLEPRGAVQADGVDVEVNRECTRMDANGEDPASDLRSGSIHAAHSRSFASIRGRLRALLSSVFLSAVLCAAAAETSAVVRVMTFNVRYGTAKDGDNHWDRRKDFLVDTIAAFDPDLLGTQETLGFQRDYILARLTNLTAWGVGRDDGGTKGEMTALFYRTNHFAKLDGGHFWLSEKPDVPGSISWDSSLTRMASWVKLRDLRDPDGPTVLFVNTHFDHKGSEARLQAAKLIRARIAELGKGCRAILTGDFNTGEGSEPYRALFGEGGPVSDAFRIANQERKPDEGSFNGFDPSATRGDRIDWIGVSTNWAVQSVKIDRATRNGRTPSDHFPVTAILGH